MNKQFSMYIWFALAATALFLIAVALMLEPTIIIGLIPLTVSFGGALVIRWHLEEQPVRSMFDRKDQSWTFLFGDGLALPVAMLMIGFARSEVAPAGFWLQWNWFLISAGAGLLSGVIFRLADRVRYRRFGATKTLSSPTKVWHDFVTYPVLFGVTVWAGVPLLIPEYWFWSTVVALAAIVVWIGLGICDAIRDLNPLGQHPEWDTRGFSVI